MPTPNFRIKADIYQTTFTGNISKPAEDTTLGPLTIPAKLGYTAGQSVLITNVIYPVTRFEAIITSYNPSIGTLNLEQTTNVKGTNYGNGITWGINLTGERGTNIYSGTSVPESTKGRPGDLYLNTTNGELFQKQE